MTPKKGQDLLCQSVDVLSLQRLGISDWEARDVGHRTSLDPILLLQHGPVCPFSSLGEDRPGHWRPVLKKLHGLDNIIAGNPVLRHIVLVAEGGIKQIRTELKISGEINKRKLAAKLRTYHIE